MRTNKKAFFYDRGEETFFYLSTTSIADTDCAGFEYDDRATDRHIRDYPREHEKYLKEREVITEVSKQMKESII